MKLLIFSGGFPCHFRLKKFQNAKENSKFQLEFNSDLIFRPNFFLEIFSFNETKNVEDEFESTIEKKNQRTKLKIEVFVTKRSLFFDFFTLQILKFVYYHRLMQQSFILQYAIQQHVLS